MDTSEQYIKMCERAEEIQKEWVPKDGDFHFDPQHGMIETYFYATSPAKCIWLPRQDQLQEMIDWKSIYIVRDKDRFKQRRLGDDLLIANSMEQLWLAFVMKEKYGKTWDGDKWMKG